MKTQEKYWGQDIALNENGQAKIAANGELILTDGVETGLQDIKLRLFTRLGTLFYDKDFGSLIHDWILEESTLSSRLAFCNEVVKCIELDPRVELGSVSCSILKWNEKSITARATFTFSGVESPLNLVFTVANNSISVQEDLNPTEKAQKEVLKA